MADVALYVGELVGFNRDGACPAQVRTDTNLVAHTDTAEEEKIHIRVLVPPVFVLDDLRHHQQIFVVNLGLRVLSKSAIQVTRSLDLIDDDPKVFEP